MPLLLSLVFSGYFALCGRAAFALAGVRLGHVRTWLLAPTLGLAVISLAVMILNQAGLPVGMFGGPLVLGTSVMAALALIHQRVAVPRALLPFIVLAVIALGVGGWPALVHGFGWLSYGNDDMSNYCVGAQRYLTQGFYDLPTPAGLAGGDYTQIYWLKNVASLFRFGSEQVLSLVAGSTGLSPLKVFMPVIMGLALIQLWAVMALAYSCPRRRTLALAAGAILVVAPLWYFGTMYQLIAQVSGLALLFAVLTLTARTRFPRRLASQLRFAFICALLISGLCIYYPELIPFYVIGWGFYMLLRPRRLGRELTRLLITVGLTAVVGAVLLRHNVLSTTLTLLGQAQDSISAGGGVARIALFPYFLTPMGPAFFFGFDVIVAHYAEPWTVISLVGGFAGLAVVLLLWARGMRERTVSSAVLAGMILVAIQLFSAHSGFGLFKLAMFALPVATIELARALDLQRGRSFIRGAFLVLLPVWLTGSLRYTRASLAQTANPVVEVFNASSSLGRLPATSGAPVWSDIASAPIAKLLMLKGAALGPVFLGQPFYSEFMGIAGMPWPDWVYPLIPGPKISAGTTREVVHYIRNEVYQPGSAAGLSFLRRPSTEGATFDPKTILVTSLGEIRSFNKLAPESWESAGLFAYLPVSRLENHLVFIRTNQGQHYYLGDAGYISIYKPEPDVYSPGSYFFVIGRHLLFRVINPTETVRLRFSLSASILGEGRTALPVSAKVRGAAPDGVGLGLIGAGSANVFSPPLRPFLLHGVAYVALDLGRSPLFIGRPAEGLQGLYNRTLSLDTRLGLGYCRDISVISGDHYELLPRKRAISRFPSDLTGPDAAEYSGLYEDGWVSEHAFVMLGPVRSGERVVVTAMLPQIPGAKPSSHRVELWVDGVLQQTREISPGNFALEARLEHAAPFVRVELRFDRTDTLPAPDNRPVSALLKSIQILPAP
jgi:hypothetical protein